MSIEPNPKSVTGPVSAVDRQRASRKRRTEKGLVRLEFMLPKETAELVRNFVSALTTAAKAKQ